MAYSESSRDKLSHYKIEGQTKPFIDQNLQLQLPGWDPTHCQTQLTCSPIYSHFIGSHPSSFATQVNEEDLLRAMEEAECSYEAWKNMQQQLKNVAKFFQSEKNE